MATTKTYQVADSSTLKNPFITEEQEEANELELLEEIDDEPIVLPKVKKKWLKKSNPDTNALKTDTFYGIKNESEIPSWNIEIKPTKKEQIEKLFDPDPIHVDVANWQIILLIISIVLLGFTKAFSNTRFKQTIRALLNFSVAQEIVREEKVFFHRSNILFTILHLLTTSLFLYRIKESIHAGDYASNGLLFFLSLIGFLIGIYLLKYTFSKILFFILNDSNIASEYVFNVSLYNNLLGIIFIPVLCLAYFSSLPFSTILLYIAIPLALVTFLLRLIRLYVIGFTRGISYFYIFLYICTLEILPLVVLFRIFIIK